MVVALHELLQEINPPATEPLPPHTDVEAVTWTRKELAAFRIVRSLEGAANQALNDTIQLRTGTKQ